MEVVLIQLYGRQKCFVGKSSVAVYAVEQVFSEILSFRIGLIVLCKGGCIVEQLPVPRQVADMEVRVSSFNRALPKGPQLLGIRLEGFV